MIKQFHFQIVGYTLGLLLLVLGVIQFIPAFTDLYYGDSNAKAFFIGSGLCLFFGGLLYSINQDAPAHITTRQAFLLTTLSWLSMAFFGSIPFYISDLNISFTDAFFESMSGITTTGATVLSNLDGQSHGVLLWRSFMQWIGGIGIIAFAIVFLPYLRVGGMQLFKTESSDSSEKLMPKMANIVYSLIGVYWLLTIICMLTYHFLGMSWFDAINHAFTSIATGGYSTHDASFGYFQNPALEMACAFFMLLGGLPFLLYLKLLIEKKFVFWQDEQFRALIKFLFFVIAAFSTWVYFNLDFTWADSLRYTTFNVISVMTTTGYATTDYMLWGNAAIMVFFFITYMGTCAGSTSGGIKIIRIIIAFRFLKSQINNLIYPHGVFQVKYQGRPVDTRVSTSVLAFLSFYVGLNVVLTLCFALTGLDFITAISAAASAIANVGPGVGDVIGPAGNFSSLSDTAKWLYCAGMLLGRLEILSIVVLFYSEFWKD